MITLEIFEIEFTVLEERFKCEYTPLVRDRYYEILSEELDDERFMAGCREIFKVAKFFPSPQEIIDAAPSLENLIGTEMRRLGVNGLLPADWRSRTGKDTVGELPFVEACAYLEYLRGMESVKVLNHAAS